MRNKPDPALLKLLQLYKQEFSTLVSYERFIVLTRTIQYFITLINWLVIMLQKARIDSTSITACNEKRINRNKALKGIAKIVKSAKDWFYEFKLYIIINNLDETEETLG